MLTKLFKICLCCFYVVAYAGNQLEEQLSLDMKLALQSAINGTYIFGNNGMEAEHWIKEVLPQIEPKLKDNDRARRLLRLVYYESLRAGLDPNLVLGIVTVESGFQQYAISSKGARGLMQVMPFWTRIAGRTSSLFDPQVNLRFGCSILRLYLIQERGNLVRSLKRYNGSLFLNDDSYVKSVLALYHQYRRQA